MDETTAKTVRIAGDSHPAAVRPSRTRTWGLNLAQVGRRRKASATVVQNRGLDGGNPIGESSRLDIEEIEAQVTISLFVDLFKTQGVLEADPARLGRSDEAKVFTNRTRFSKSRRW